MDVKEFLKKSIEKNNREAKEYLKKERLRRMKNLSNANGLPSLFIGKTLDNYNRSKNPIAYKAAKDFVESFPNTKGLLFSGGVGLGKQLIIHPKSLRTSWDLEDRLFLVELHLCVNL